MNGKSSLGANSPFMTLQFTLVVMVVVTPIEDEEAVELYKKTYAELSAQQRQKVLKSIALLSFIKREQFL